MRLQVAVGARYVSDFDAEEDMAAVAGPARTDLHRLVGRDAARFGQGGVCVTAGSRGRGPLRLSLRAGPRYTQIDGIDFDVFVLFLALVDRVAHKCEFAAIGRSDQTVDAQRSGGDGVGAGSQIRFLLGSPSFFFTLAGAAAWRARATERSRAKMVS